MTESPLEINENSEKRYYKGKINFIIRLYYYLQQGLNQINSAHSVILALLAVAVALRIESNYHLIVIIGLSGIPIIILIGWLWVVRGKKSTEYFELKRTTVFGRYTIEMQERNIQQNEEIISLLKELLNK